MPGGSHWGPGELAIDISPFQTRVARPALVVFIKIARPLSAITIRKLWKKKNVYYLQALEHRRHAGGHTVRLWEEGKLVMTWGSAFI